MSSKASSLFGAVAFLLGAEFCFSQIPPRELVIRERSGELFIEWSDARAVLEFAPDPAGPWHSIPGASSPYNTVPGSAHRFFRLGSGGVSDPSAGAVAASFAARAEANLGTWLYLPQSDWMFTRGQRWTPVRSGARPALPVYRSMSGHFIAGSDSTPVAVYFSAEAYVDIEDKRMFVRALVDGTPLSPEDVVFTVGTSPENRESRAFVFAGTVDAGLHTVEMQWMVDREATAYMRNAAFLVRKGTGLPDDRAFYAVSPPSGPSVSTSSASWEDVPGLSGSVEVREGDSLLISVSAESFVQGNGAMFLRALVDGQPAQPADVLFARGSKPQCRLFNFGQTSPDPGVHNVRIQWTVNDRGVEGFMGDRSLVLSATSKKAPDLAQVLSIPASGAAEVTSSTSFVPMPGMTASGPLPRNGEVAVILSAITSVAGNDNLRVRLNIDGDPVPGSEVQLAESSVHQGAHSFVFSAKHLYPDAPPPTSTISVEWRVENGETASLDDRTMVVLAKPPTVPDLAQPPPLGLSNFGIEAGVGPRRLLVILWDPDRTGHPAPSVAAAEAAVFGAAESIQHYYAVVSGEKFSLENALAGNTVLGWYDAAGPSSQYFDSDPGCQSGASPNGQDRRRKEALERAEQDINFADFDDNKDGVLDPQLELGILMVIPDSSGPSEGKVRFVYDNQCNPLSVGGVIIPLIAEWLTDFSVGEFMVGAHELAHLILGLDDNYLSTAIDTEAGRLSLMELFGADHTPHPDAFNKLALGWVTPHIIQGEGIYNLEDVKLSGEVLVLPRLPGGGFDEYVILENRQDAASNLLYDKNLFDSGIAVWHVIESSTDNALPPPCMSAAVWNGEVGNGNARRGNRLVRPWIKVNNVNTLWNSDHYNLLDDGLTCSAADPADRRNALIWADGTASGFHIINWSAAGNVMTFQVVGP